ncbi:FkbM family methyltransferase [Methylobacterium sp. WL103]|uniref:FkbM family methyltransferase n=1 Tax=Methylobacterium sp. WL103 TaxID=2603891 RepID=UPI0011CB6061|nr:FkbM family methyltransferase [Methylobacterium sp. WL103]TXN08119.1 FkbM family methyltransferase [Methylobacterium sp. WL103]
MVTYAQNFEDVLLRRALPEITRGFYIDIGAFHPVIDNVSYWFYSQGWTGINVEPNPRFQALLRQQRPHDVNLQAAVGGQSGTLRLHLFDGLSTTVGDIAEQHTASGQQAEGMIDVDALSLHDLFEQHTDGRTIDFLKIDVEGAEGPILEAYPFTTVRPRILVIEATEPDSITLSSNAWEDGLLGKGYQFCYFDGLNRYYVRDEDAWRKGLFDAPPNVFDHFLIPHTDRRVDYVASARATLDQIPEGGIRGLVAERDRLRVERDAWARECALRVDERDRLAQQLTAERDLFALELAGLMQEQATLMQAETAESAALRIAERDLFALELAGLMQEQATLMQAETAESAALRIAERDLFALELAGLTQEQTTLIQAKEAALSAQTNLAEQRGARIATLEAEERRLAAARDISLVKAARLQIKVDALTISAT